MSKSVLVIGDSGQGKSTSIHTLDPESTFIINVIGKDLPFKGWKSKYQLFDKVTKKGNMAITQDAEAIVGIMKAVSEKYPQYKTIIIDDWQYVLSFEFMARAKEKGSNISGSFKTYLIAGITLESKLLKCNNV